jgi:hypothetical protein
MRNLIRTSLATMSNLAQLPSPIEKSARRMVKAVEDAAVALRREGGGDDDILRLALDAQLAGDFIAVAAERLDAAGHEAGGREGLGVEPGLAGNFVVAFRGAGIDAGQFDIEACLGGGRLGRVETELAGKRLNLPSTATPICL